MHTFLIVIQYIGIIISMLEVFYLLEHKSSKQQRYLTLLMIALCINSVGYLLEMQAQTQGEALLAVKFLYLGKPYLVLCQFLFVLELCKVKLPHRIVSLLFLVHTAVIFLVLTCEKHTLFYSGIEFVDSGFFPHLILHPGPVYRICSILIVFYMAVMTVVCLKRYFKSRLEEERKQFCYLMLINIVTVLGFLIYLSGVTHGYDITLLAYFIDSILFSVLIFREKLFNALALAKDLAIDSLAEGLIVVDSGDEVVYYNQKAEEIYENISCGEAEEILEDMDEYILEKKSMKRDRRVYEVSSHLIEQEDEYYGKMYVLTDMTDSYHYTQSIKEQAEIMKELKEQAESANAAKSAFVSSMSHEIRTPMNAIIGLTDVLLRKEWSAEEKGYLLHIKSSGNALLKLINDLLDFSKIEAGKYEIINDTYDIAQMLRDIQMIGETRIGDKGVRLVMDVDEAIPRLLYGDALRIRQVIINIMNNAIKFTDRGSVTVTVKKQKQEADRVQLYISVRDTGQGIREQDLKSLFDAFTQVDIKKNKGKEGTGLGLAISRQLVELMGGNLEVASEYGKGSEFYFTLWEGIESEDLIGDFSQIQDQKEEEEDFFTFTMPEAKILLVDDNEINVEVAKALLEPFEMQITTASNGQEALDEIQREPEYDMVFMDHFMPVMDGVEASRRIRDLEEAYFKEVPIIALTADAVQGVREEFFAVGMNDFVSKPISMKEMSRVLQQWMPKEKIVRD